MKKALISIGVGCLAIASFAFPKAIYVKSGDTYSKYNFGVAENLVFADGGKMLHVTGYSEAIDLSKIDYITFSAPVDNSALTPGEQKQKLVDIGSALYEKINARDQKDIYCLVEDFKKVAHYYVDEEYYDVYKSVRKFATSATNVLNGSFADVRSARAAAATVYKCDDFFGIFQANRRREEWEKIADADFLEIRFPDAYGEIYKVRFESSKACDEVTHEDYVGHLPSKMNITIAKGPTVLAEIAMDATCDDATKAFGLDFVLTSNGYIVETDLAVDNSFITDETTVTVKGEELVNAKVRIKGDKLTDVDNWEDEIENSTTDDEYYDDYNYEWVHVDGNLDNNIASHFHYAIADVDVMGLLQVHGKVSSLSKLFDVMEQESWLKDYEYVWNYDKSVRTCYYSDSEVVDSKVNHLNSYSDLHFCYDGDKKIQGYLSWDVDEDSYECIMEGYWDEASDRWVDHVYKMVYQDYDLMPLLVFPDLTSFAIEDYFETGFTRLIDDYEDIVDTYNTIVDRY